MSILKKGNEVRIKLNFPTLTAVKFPSLTAVKVGKLCLSYEGVTFPNLTPVKVGKLLKLFPLQHHSFLVFVTFHTFHHSYLCDHKKELNRINSYLFLLFLKICSRLS